MELEGKVAVVTGGASGIGRALAQRLSEAGAAGVVVADIDAAGAHATAEAISARRADAAVAIGCDAAAETDLKRALAAAADAFGPVDLFCANAGVAVGADEQAPDEEWDLAFAVNIRAHVLAARLLVPDWLRRGSGYFLSTASAAGLLTQVGSAPYAVTKHAAVAFAEWLSVTYGERGIRVSCLCPMGVNTNMLRSDSGNPDSALPTAVVRAAGDVLDPGDVAATVVEALRDERFLILPHPEVLKFFQLKGADYERWLAGMRRLQATVSAQARG